MAGCLFWTTGELVRLTALVGRYPTWQIGMKLNRTTSAIRKMCWTMRISYRQTTKLNSAEFIERMAGLMPTPEIAWRLECSTRTIQKRARALGISLRMIRLGRPLIAARKSHHPGISYIRDPRLIRKRWMARPGGQYIGYFATEAEAWTAIKERDHVEPSKGS